MTEQSIDPRWKTISMVVAESGLKERTVYRLVQNGTLPSKKTEGGTLVDVDAAKALAAARAAARRPAAALSAGIDGGRQAAAGGGAMADDGELAARVIARLEDGASPIEIVRELRLPPQRVRQLHREWRALREEASEAVAQRVSVDERVAELELLFRELEARCVSLDQRLRELAPAAVVFSELAELKCDCGRIGEFSFSVFCVCQQRWDVRRRAPSSAPAKATRP